MPKVEVPMDHPIVHQVERLSRMLGFTGACLEGHINDARCLRKAIRLYLNKEISRATLEKLCDESLALEERTETVMTAERKLHEEVRG